MLLPPVIVEVNSTCAHALNELVIKAVLRQRVVYNHVAAHCVTNKSYGKSTFEHAPVMASSTYKPAGHSLIQQHCF